LTADCTSLDDLVSVTESVEWFSPMQQHTEIVNLLRLVQELQPSMLMEIGSAKGGTLFLLTRMAAADARLLALDLDLTPAKLAVFPTFAQRAQQITCIQGDSHSPSIRRQIDRWLNGRQLDFLLIDGDHSYEGVSRDYELYGPLVRPGGLIAFHDIVPDFRTRYGVASTNYAGGVPQFWAELRQRAKDTGEFIQHTKQDGYGIGYIRVAGASRST
jgi:cephalosporin hydroxylase